MTNDEWAKGAAANSGVNDEVTKFGANMEIGRRIIGLLTLALSSLKEGTLRSLPPKYSTEQQSQ